MADSETEKLERQNFLERIVEKVDGRVVQSVFSERPFANFANLPIITRLIVLKLDT